MQEGSKLQKSFTLIELLVVVLIIGILATLIIMSVAHNAQKSRDTKRKADLQTIADAFDAYYYQNGTYQLDKSNCGASNTAEGFYKCDRTTCNSQSYPSNSIAQCLVAAQVLGVAPADPLFQHAGANSFDYMVYYVIDKRGQKHPEKGVCIYAHLESYPSGTKSPEWNALTDTKNEYYCPSGPGSFGMNYVVRRLVSVSNE
jgi:prepilin-type N-terminal cleavage/methylation domain-containing protein